MLSATGYSSAYKAQHQPHQRQQLPINICRRAAWSVMRRWHTCPAASSTPVTVASCPLLAACCWSLCCLSDQLQLQIVAAAVADESARVCCSGLSGVPHFSLQHLPGPARCFCGFETPAYAMHSRCMISSIQQCNFCGWHQSQT